MKTILFFSFFSIFLFSCKSQQYTIDNLPEKQLVFGSGGGMTGAFDTYILLENGQLFYSNSMTKEDKELEKISKKESKVFFSNLDAMTISEMNFNHPGNMYYFLEEVNGDERHRVTWGSNNHEISEECKEFYKELRTTIK